MAELTIVDPGKITTTPERFRRVDELFERWVRTGEIPAAAYCVGRGSQMTATRTFGSQVPGTNQPVRPDALYLIASLTKPVTVLAGLILVERGLITLDDRVADYVPAFAKQGKDDVRIRHLMTHTSGLPDMLPENDRLRSEHRPFSAFIEGICELSLLFEPGTAVRYQSMGTAMLAEVVHQVAGVTLPEFLRSEVFEPLGMRDTALGCPKDWMERVVAVKLGEAQLRTDWHWNTPYWLGFGAPWGGLITTAADYGRLCRMMLAGGAVGAARVLSPAGCAAMTVNQLEAMPRIPEEDRRCRPWGLGWRLNWRGSSSNFGDLLGARCYGHWGATGTLCWMDPVTDCFTVIFTTQPQGDDGRHLARASNAIAAALS